MDLKFAYKLIYAIDLAAGLQTKVHHFASKYISPGHSLFLILYILYAFVYSGIFDALYSMSCMQPHTPYATPSFCQLIRHFLHVYVLTAGILNPQRTTHSYCCF